MTKEQTAKTVVMELASEMWNEVFNHLTIRELAEVRRISKIFHLRMNMPFWQYYFTGKRFTNKNIAGLWGKKISARQGNLLLAMKNTILEKRNRGDGVMIGIERKIPCRNSYERWVCHNMAAFFGLNSCSIVDHANPIINRREINEESSFEGRKGLLLTSTPQSWVVISSNKMEKKRVEMGEVKKYEPTRVYRWHGHRWKKSAIEEYRKSLTAES